MDLDSSKFSYQFFYTVKCFYFLDVPDAKVAVPPQKPAEGKITNHTCFVVLFYISIETTRQ